MTHKTKYVLFIFVIALSSVVLSLFIPSEPSVLPFPTEGTFVKTDMEDVSQKDLKRLWMDMIHQSAPGTDWKEKERHNSIEKLDLKLSRIQSGAFLNKDGQIDIENGSIVGSWSEKGSNNQAGSILKTIYNKLDDRLYAISAGGSLWKGRVDGLTWDVVNQDLRFDGRFLELAVLPDNSQRFVSSINGHPYYSEGGLEWTNASPFNTNTSPKNKNTLSVNSGKNIFFLSKIRHGENIKLYHSDDYGKSFHSIKTFLTSDLDNMAIAKSGNRVFAIEQKSISKSRVFEWDSESDILQLLEDNSSISFGANGKGNLKATGNEDIIKLFAYDGNDMLKSSNNFGLSWSELGTLPRKPWDDGFFISEANPDIMIMGEVEAYRSSDGGRNWTKLNAWYEYYENKSTKLHADIMSIHEFERNGLYLIAISNHGGISTSYDSGQTFGNIGLTGLNISQYYDVSSYPLNNSIIFGGSQDQGLQRTTDLGEGPAYFEQIISGDYGHLTFTNFDKSLWAVFPGGWISYYENPITSNHNNYDASFQLENGQQSVWIPPIVKSPYNHNAIILAGGSLTGNNGSYLVEVRVNDFGDIAATQLPFNFDISGGEISAMAFNNFNSREFYVLTTNGKFYKSTDSAQSFTEKSQAIPEAHYLYGSSIYTSKINEDILYLSGSGYDNASVFKSEDGGETFFPMDEGLPPTTVFKLAATDNEKYIFAATEAGPYVYLKNFEKWYDLAQGVAPNQAYWDVEYLQEENKVRYATYGRGIWNFNIEQLTNTVSQNLLPAIQLSPNPSTDFININLGSNKCSIIIISHSGQMIKSFANKNSGNLKIDISDFINGIYYIIFDDGIQLSSKSFIKI